MSMPSAMNSTWPPKTGPAVELMVAVNVTPLPNVDVPELLVMDVPVGERLTVWGYADVVLEMLRLVVPLYEAVMGCVCVAFSPLIGPQVAMPELTGRAEHPTMVVPSDLKFTVPPATVPAAELTVALKVMPSPNVAGFGSLATEMVVVAGLTV